MIRAREFTRGGTYRKQNGIISESFNSEVGRPVRMEWLRARFRCGPAENWPTDPLGNAASRRGAARVAAARRDVSSSSSPPPHMHTHAHTDTFSRAEHTHMHTRARAPRRNHLWIRRGRSRRRVAARFPGAGVRRSATRRRRRAEEGKGRGTRVARATFAKIGGRGARARSLSRASERVSNATSHVKPARRTVAREK